MEEWKMKELKMAKGSKGAPAFRRFPAIPPFSI
jgi:hypothetical protein